MHKLGICIPYRNRKEHIDRLIPHLTKHLNERGIEHSFYVGHQIDDKLFNRGAMKNIAAHIAFEDGCDYIAWHDVDMLPDQEADYSYPEETPIHIATKLSKYGYNLGYDQYFGGVVLFNKEQAYLTNGYSNDYWDWGQEDDDLFWRCYFESLTTGRIIKKEADKLVANFNGDNSYLAISTNREISSCLHRKDGSWTWGVSFNNSRAVTMQLFDRNGMHHYNWAKRFEGMWTQIVFSFDNEEKNAYFYVNDELISQMNGVKQNIPFPVKNDLKAHDSVKPFLLGFCNHSNVYYKGKICDVKIYNKYFSNISDLADNKENLVLDCDFNSQDFVNQNVTFTNEDIEIIENVVPYRRESKFYCLPHIDEGFVNGTWAKGETTARNEKRFVTEMQQKKIDYKNDGLKQVLNTLDIINIDSNQYENTKFINVKMK